MSVVSVRLQNLYYSICGQEAIKQMETERATLSNPSFETIWLAVLNHPDFEAADLSRLTRIVNVGIPERLRAMCSMRRRWRA